jgi:hypothetical protein
VADTVVAVNQTAGDLALVQLSAVDAEIPASGSANLSDYNTPTEIAEDSELQDYINNDEVLLQVNGVLLTKEQSLSYGEGATSIKSKLDATTSPAVTDDDEDGYSVGSLWVDITGDAAYTCVDATTGAAVWKAQGAAGSFDLQVEEDDSLVANNVDTLNFEGDVSVVDDGGGKVTITASGDALPPATQVGQVLSSIDGSTFEVQLPLTSCNGWLLNDDGVLLVVG